MTVVLLCMAALAVVIVIALFASKGDKGGKDEDPDLTREEKRSAAVTTAAIAGVAQKDKREH